MSGFYKGHMKRYMGSTCEVEQVLRRTHKLKMSVSPPKGRFKKTSLGDLTSRGQNGIMSLEFGKTPRMKVVYN